MSATKFDTRYIVNDQTFNWNASASCFVSAEYKRALVFPPNGRWAKGWLVMIPGTRKQQSFTGKDAMEKAFVTATLFSKQNW